MRHANARILFAVAAAFAICGAAPGQTCDTRQAAQRAAEAALSPSDRRMISNFPPRITARNDRLYWEVAWSPSQIGARPVVKMVNRATCNVISAYP